MNGGTASLGGCGDMLLLRSQLCFPIYACAREVIKAYHEPLSALNLTYTQYLVMMVLWEEKKKSVRELGECLYLSRTTLRAEGDLFLDDMTPEELSEGLGVPAVFVDNDGGALFDALTGIEY